MRSITTVASALLAEVANSFRFRGWLGAAAEILGKESFGGSVELQAVLRSLKAVAFVGKNESLLSRDRGIVA